MRTFTDNAGRSWTITVNVDGIKRVRSLLDVNLLDVVDGQLLERIVSDPILLCDVIYCLVKPEADSKQVADEDFGRAMAGDAIDHATTALLEELVDFFPGPKRRVLAKALTKLRMLEARAIEVAETRLDDPTLEAQMEAVLHEQIAGNSSGNSPVSSALIPDR